MTLYAAQNNSMLIWIIQAKQKSFTFRCLFHQGSGAKTLHETGRSKECRHDEVQRLAPRRELVRSYNPDNAVIRQSLRFTHGISNLLVTITVTGKTSQGMYVKNLLIADFSTLTNTPSSLKYRYFTVIRHKCSRFQCLGFRPKYLTFRPKYLRFRTKCQRFNRTV